MLRLISFAMDYYWCVTISSTPAGLSSAMSTLSVEDYSFKSYLSYALYPPLYIAGPIMTFNDFILQVRYVWRIKILTLKRCWQLKSPPQLQRKSKFGYAGRFLISFFTMEWILHYIYVVAIKDSATPLGIRAWQGDSPMELTMIGYWNLIIIWLKVRVDDSRARLNF